MRIAFVDLIFAWPPPGGAQADLYHTMRGLQALGHEVHLFGACYDFAWQYGAFDPGTLPFPSTPIWFSERSYTRRNVRNCFRQAVDAWKPDVVFLGFGGWLKPYLIDTLAHYPIISRYYMYEHLCIRDLGLFRKKKPCPWSVLSTPNTCSRCAFRDWGVEIRSGRPSLWGLEYAQARAYLPSYPGFFAAAMRKVRVAIVNNPLAKQRLDAYCPTVLIVPGGVDIANFAYRPSPDKGPGDRKVILMVGRADDRRKGADVLVKAAEGLWQVRQDFEIWITSTPDWGDSDLELQDFEWLKYVGWHDHSQIKNLYQRADICVVPSVWEEPFGLVAVEAMATGRPVCASRVGGLQEIVRNGETGLLFKGGSSTELAIRLMSLLDDPAMRRRMGDAGRKRVEAEYDWGIIVSRHLPEALARAVR